MLLFQEVIPRLYEHGSSAEEVWYRVDGASTDDALYLVSYTVLRHTDKGVWLDVYGEEKFVLNGVGKRWANPTRHEAMVSFIARKKMQIRILSAQLNSTKDKLATAERLLKEIEK
jgi:hypothetical protein